MFLEKTSVKKCKKIQDSYNSKSRLWNWKHWMEWWEGVKPWPAEMFDSNQIAKW